MAITNKELKDIMTEVGGHVIVLSAKVDDVKTEQAKVRSEVEKQTALANQVHAVHDERLDKHDGLFDKLFDSIKGNGKPGLEAKIDVIDARLKWLIALLVALAVPIYGGLISLMYDTISTTSPAYSQPPSLHSYSYQYPVTAPAPTTFRVLPTPTRNHGNNQ
jgi:hypothetical protein